MDVVAKPEPFADGIYFGLPEDPYHADPALGSTDLKQLALDPGLWWWDSALNPERDPPEEDKPHRILGRAAHKFVLEGEAAFRELYLREPTEGVLRTSDELGAWLKAREQKVPASKGARIEAIKGYCFEAGADMPLVLELFEAAATLSGQAILRADAFDRICRAGNAVRANPHLAESFVSGQPEVSVFWTEQHDDVTIRRKGRFDYLKPRAIVDLKSTTPRLSVPFDSSCTRALADFDYPSQAAGYLQGRGHVGRFVAEGRVFGDHDPAWLKRVAAVERSAFVFVFWTSSGAPQTWGTILSPGNPVLDVGAAIVQRGCENYAASMRFHGPEASWLSFLPLEELSIDRMPRWWGNTY